MYSTLHCAARVSAVLAGCAFLIASVSCGAKQTERGGGELTVFAAASAKDAITQAAAAFEQATGVSVHCTFDSTLSESQDERSKRGALGDVLISDDQVWIDRLQSAGEIEASTRRDVFGNQLALIAPKGAQFYVNVHGPFDFAQRLPQLMHIAVPDLTETPAGRHVKAALEFFDWWDGVQDRLVAMPDGHDALQLVENRQADAGIVYLTDAIASQNVTTVVILPSESHPSIRYLGALRKDAGKPARDFLDYLQTKQVQTAFTNRGFTILKSDEQLLSK